MPSEDQATTAGPNHGAAQVLHNILEQMKNPRASFAENGEAAKDSAKLGDLIDRLDERAFGLMLLLLALPCCLPFIYLLPQIVALPMLALAGQLAAGRQHPWLPNALHEREFSIPAFQSVITKSER